MLTGPDSPINNIASSFLIYVLIAVVQAFLVVLLFHVQTVTVVPFPAFAFLPSQAFLAVLIS